MEVEVAEVLEPEHEQGLPGALQAQLAGGRVGRVREDQVSDEDGLAGRDLE